MNLIWGIILLLCIIWVVAVVAKFFIGGLIHLLLVVALIGLIYQVVKGIREKVS